MSLITPDFGLIFWMTLIFGIVLFILWKFGFPAITDMVGKRADHIDRSLKLAAEAEKRMKDLAKEQEEVIAAARKEQAAMLKAAADERREIIEKARDEAREEAGKIMEGAREEIAREKEAALRDVRREVASLSVGIAEKLLRAELSDEKASEDYLNRLIDESENG